MNFFKVNSLLLIFAFAGCASGPSGPIGYGRSEIVNYGYSYASWSDGYIDVEIYKATGSPSLFRARSFLVGYQLGGNLPGSPVWKKIEPIAKFRASELAADLNYSCLIIAEEELLQSRSSIGGSSRSYNFSGVISGQNIEGIISPSPSYLEINADRFLLSPRINHAVVYLILPGECRNNSSSGYDDILNKLHSEGGDSDWSRLLMRTPIAYDTYRNAASILVPSILEIQRVNPLK